MADLEQEKDLEEDEFKTNAKPTTSRTMTTRICKRNVKYPSSDESSDSEEDNSSDESSDEESGDNYDDGYSSPDVDYESIANYEEENSVESTKINAKTMDQSSKIHDDCEDVEKTKELDKPDDLYNYDPGCDYE